MVQPNPRSRRSRATRIAQAWVAVVVVVLTSGPLAARAADDGKPVFGVHPEFQGSTTLSHGHFRFDLTPGSTVRDGIVINNFSDAPLTVTVYSADLVQAQGGGLAPAQQDQVMKSVGTWIKVDFQTVTLKPKETVTDEFTVAVPISADPGTHVGAVVAAANVSNNGAVIVQGRTALIAEVVVPGVAAPGARVGPLHSKTETQGALSFTVGITNTGNTFLGMKGSVVVRDGGGIVVARIPLKPADAYAIPGGTLDLRTEQQWQPQPGDYTAIAEITGSSGDKPVATFASQPIRLSYPNIARRVAIAAGSVLVLLLVGVAVYVIRRRSKRLQPPTDQPTT